MGMRIGLTQRVQHLEGRSERRDCLDQQWIRLLESLGLAPMPMPNCLKDVEAFVDANHLQGLILTGGNDLAHLAGARSAAPERDATERALLALARQRDLPALGVCRGMQMMVAEAGGRLIPIEDHVAVTHAVEVRAGSTMPLGDRELVNSFHDFGVPPDGLGRDWRAAALAPDGTVEAAAHLHHRHWAIMWHPERDPRDSRDRELIRALFTERE